MILLKCLLKWNGLRYYLNIAAYVLTTFFLWNEAQAELRTVAITGQTAPDDNGVFASTFGNPVINEAGQVAFLAGFSGTSGGTDNNVAYLKGSLESLEVLARKGDNLPSGDGTYRFPINFNVFQISLDDAGNTNVLAQIDGPSDSAQFALVHFDGEGAVEIVRDRQVQNAEAGNLFEVESGNVLGFYHPVVGDDGEVYFLGVVDGPSIGETFVIHRWDRTSSLEYIIGSEDEIVENSSFFLRGQLRVTSSDRLAITTNYLEDGEFQFEGGVAEWTPEDGHRTFIRHNDVTPDKMSNFTSLGPIAILDASKDGRILVSAHFITPTGTGQGIFVETEAGLVEVAKQGDDVDGSVLRTGIKGKLGAPNVTWFTAQTEGTGTYSLFRADPDGAELILKQEDPMPGIENTTLDNVGEIYPNTRGDVLFYASTRQDGVAKVGYYMWRDCRFVEVAIEGQTYEGSTIKSFTGISVGRPIGTGDWPIERHINDEGLVALQFQLQDGRNGIGIWTPPPPIILPQLRVRRENNDGILSFTGLTGFTYQLEKLAAGGDWAVDWSDFGDPISGTGLLHEVVDTDVINALDVFYRLKLAQ